MNFHKYSKIPTNTIGGIFLFLTLNFALLTFNFHPALAQDAIQCKPPKLLDNTDNPFSGINLNSNLRLINSTDDALNDIYLGTGEIYFGNDFNKPYAANDGGGNLLIRNDSAQIINRSNTIEFQNSSGSSFAQFFTSGSPSLTGTGKLLVNGDIEGLGEVQGSQVCVTGSSPQCISDWKKVNDVLGTYGELRCDGVLGTCTNVVATNNVQGAKLCLQGISLSCIDDWEDVMSNVSNMFNMTDNMFEIKNGGNFVMGTGSTFRVCDDINIDGNYDANNTPPDDFDDPGECRGSGRGVSKIIAGSGISVTPPSGDGDVTVSTKIIWCNGTCPAW